MGSNPTLSADVLPDALNEAIDVDLDQLMGLALAEANRALVHHDIPIGAIVVDGAGEVLASRHNERELTGDPTAHAEVLALRDAAAKLGTWRLSDCTLVVTIEPCVMCAGACHSARVGTVVFGALDLKAGALGSLYNVGTDARLNHEFGVVGGVRAEEGGGLLTAFFRARRGLADDQPA